MHPVLLNLFHGLAEKIDEDPEKFVRKARTLGRRLRKKLSSPKLKSEIEQVMLRALAKKLRSVR